jgi:hypothetical protein
VYDAFVKENLIENITKWYFLDLFF